ncbi:four helix bundle protein [Luteolibacter sp. LG18]|uniref:four helix bundle protein n=1 Tax=Luteolibacter sp. LG18 TaxID=2819286 RepID=UPI002B29D7EE|nr:four helix bundle protein [Luteolibacter sp. LG18]
MSSHHFENLEVWKRACCLAVNVCVASHDSKSYALKDQIQRSAISIPSNIAEGAERPSDADFLRFLGYSKGSCGELRTQLLIHREVCRELNIEPFEGTQAMIEETRDLSRMLGGLIQHLEPEDAPL